MGSQQRIQKNQSTYSYSPASSQVDGLKSRSFVAETVEARSRDESGAVDKVQRQKAQQLGHNLANIAISAPRPPLSAFRPALPPFSRPIPQPRWKIEQPNEPDKQQAEQIVNLQARNHLQLRQVPAQPTNSPAASSPEKQQAAQGEAETQPTTEPKPASNEVNNANATSQAVADSNGAIGRNPGNSATEPSTKKSDQNSVAEATATQTTADASAKGGSSVPASPEEDPGFQAVASAVGSVATQEQQHNPASAEAQAAQAAAQSPPNEVESQAQNQQVGVMDQQQPGTFNAEAFKAALLEKIAAIIPETEEKAKDFGDNNEIDSVRQDVSSQVSDEREQAAGPIQEATEAEPDTSQIDPRTSTPLEPQAVGTATTEVGAERAVPPSRPDSDVSAPLAANTQEIDQQMAKANVTQEQLANSNEPEFQSALGARNEVRTHAAEAPSAYRQQEQGILNQTQANAQATSQQQLATMHGDREALLTQVAGQQSQTRSQDEVERANFANKINGIYETTKTKVKSILDGLDAEVTSKFDTAAARAKQVFEDYVKEKMDAWEEKRYGEWYDVTGYDERISDAWHGLPPEVNQFFVDGKQKYIETMDAALTGIANHVAAKLNEAKQRIAEGRQKIQEEVAKLPQSLQQYGQEAEQNIQARFDELEDSVNSKQDELIDSLAQRYSESLQGVNARIEEMKEANRGLKDKAMDAIGGAIKTILELKNMLMGVLARAAGAVEKIILDPIEFLGNLVSGIKQGFENFVGNILEHLKKGLIGWLTGALAGAGIQIPESFDLMSIFKLVMQVLGLAYDAIKSRAIKALGKNGEQIFNALETAFEIFIILKNEGIGGLWRFIQDKIGDLKAMVLDTIQNFVIETVIKQGVLWIISLLNPASAFIKACKMIYDVIMFFIERGSQIVDLVNAVTESVTSIANGALGIAAKLVEGALSKALPVVISFMASLLGLGGISDKIRDIIQMVKEPIDNAIDWLIAQAVQFAKKIGHKLGFDKDKENKQGKESQEGAILDFQVQEPFSMSGEDHKLTAKVNKGQFEIIIASNPQEFEFALTNAINEVKDSKRSEDDKRYYLTVLGRVLKEIKDIKYDMKNNEERILKGVKRDPESEKQALEQYIKSRQADIANQIQSFAATAKINSLDDFYKAPPSERYIPGYPDQTTVGKFIRDKLYNLLGWGDIREQVKSSEKKELIQKVKAAQKNGDQGAWQQLINTGLVEPNASINSYDPDNVDYHVDHIEPLAKRWNQQGHNSNDSRREQELRERTNLRLVTASYNTSKGSGGINYLPYVGPNFTSRFAEGGINGALKVHGQPFLDVSGEPVV